MKKTLRRVRDEDTPRDTLPRRPPYEALLRYTEQEAHIACGDASCFMDFTVIDIDTINIVQLIAIN